MLNVSRNAGCWVCCVLASFWRVLLSSVRMVYMYSSSIVNIIRAGGNPAAQGPSALGRKVRAHADHLLGRATCSDVEGFVMIDDVRWGGGDVVGGCRLYISYDRLSAHPLRGR